MISNFLNSEYVVQRDYQANSYHCSSTKRAPWDAWYVRISVQRNLLSRCFALTPMRHSVVDIVSGYLFGKWTKIEGRRTNNSIN